MRLLIKLEACGPELTCNYYYPFSASIYKLLKFGSPEFAAFLHETGFRQNKRTYKLFTFSLRFENISFIRDKILLKSNKVNLYVSSPLIDSFIQNFVIGTFQSQQIEIIGDNIKTVFHVMQMEALPEPGISDSVSFISLSPIVLSVPKVINNKMVPEYIRYNDDMDLINRLLNENLKNKYTLLHNNSCEEKNVRLEWDREYIKQKEKRNKKLTILQTIKSGTNQQTKVVGNILPFKLTGDIGLIKTGYECGFGDMNSMGFGMADIVSRLTY